MSSKWKTLPLASVVSRVTEKNDVGVGLVLTVSAQHGLVDQEEYFKKRIASRDVSRYTVVQPGDFVYNKSYSSMAPAGVVARNLGQVPGVVSPLYFVFRVVNGLMLPEFLTLVTSSQSFESALLRLTKEGGRAHGAINITLREFFGLEVLCPPIEVQRRIADLLASVDTFIEGLEKQAKAARTARNSVLHELLNADGDDWTETTLGGVAEWFSGGTPKVGKAEFYQGGTIPWVVIADMAETEIYATARSITQEGLRDIGGRLAPVGSVLISMYATVGRAAFAHLPVATNQAIAWSVPNQALVLPRFLLFVAQALETKVSAMARGATQKNINREILRSIEFRLPPMDLQRQIVDLLSSMDDVILATERAVIDARMLRSGLLSDLLSGSHEIPQSYDKFLGAA